MSHIKNGENSRIFLNASLRKLHEINETHLKLANHWLKLKGLYDQQKYIACLDERAISDRRELEIEAAKKIQNWWRAISRCHRNSIPKVCKENLPNMQPSLTHIKNFVEEPIFPNGNEIVANILQNVCSQVENVCMPTEVFNECRQTEIFNQSGQTEVFNESGNAETLMNEQVKSAIKIQAWWRGAVYRRQMLPDHKERLLQCVKEIREAPCSEANPKTERQLPLNHRIRRYLDGLLSSVLTERKAMAIRLNRLASRSHVCIECMISRNAFGVIIESLSDLNRSEAHLYVMRPLCDLIVKLLLYKPFVEPYVEQSLDGLVCTSVKLIHNNYKDNEVVASLSKALGLLASYVGFRDKLKSSNYAWYLQRFHQQFGRLKSKDSRYAAYRKLCKLLDAAIVE